MTSDVDQTPPPEEKPHEPLDPALLRLIEAMARADVERDYAAWKVNVGLSPTPGSKD